MDQPTPKDEEVEPNHQELEERMEVNYLNKNDEFIREMITRCWKDLLHPWTWYVVFALHLLQIIYILEVNFDLELHAKNFLNPKICVAHTCYSCRAFFRRTAQRKAAKGLKRCRTGQKKCEVSDEKKNCIHCRYLKCLQIGMTTDLMKVTIVLLFLLYKFIYIDRDNGKKMLKKVV